MPNTYARTQDGTRVEIELDEVGVSESAPEWAQREWEVTARVDNRTMSFPFYGGALAEPTADDVAESLELDAIALDMPFEEWAADLGYDSDSRRALATYEACRKLAAEWRELVTGYAA